MKTKKLFLSMAAIACMTMTSLMTSCSVEDNAVDERPDLDLSAFIDDIPTVAGPSRFICDVKLIGTNNQYALEDDLGFYKSQGWTIINQDLNSSVGGDYIYLLYKYNNSNSPYQGTPITQLYLSNDKNPTDVIKKDGKTYRLVSTIGSDAFRGSKGNLNSGTKKGDVIHLYYTRDSFDDGRALSSIDVNNTKRGAVAKNGAYDYVTQTKKDGYDMNAGAGGKSLYLHAEVDSKPEMW